jgi:hypothetical protein
MRNLLESLSLGSGAAVVAVLSAGIVWLLCRGCAPPLRKFWAVVVPFLVACCLYWSPVWLGADPSEYHAWAAIGIGAWFVAGALASGAVVFMMHGNRAK